LEEAVSCLSGLFRISKVAKRHWLRRDVHAMGRPESCLCAQPAGLHGEDPDGKKGNRKKWLPRKMGTGIEKN